jgi:hypothetical protein
MYARCDQRVGEVNDIDSTGNAGGWHKHALCSSVRDLAMANLVSLHELM